MTNITIIGWYGTETIGDRAILAGLFHLFSESYGSISIKLGCLETLLSERTLAEDTDFFTICANQKLTSISLFDSRVKKELDEAIKWSDIVAIGGGPLMEIDAIYMLLYAFKKAKRLKRKTIVAGCGIGPFKTERLFKVSLEIVDLSDLTIFRDSKSLKIYQNTKDTSLKEVYASIDPAVIAAQCYKQINKERLLVDNYVAVNFREPPIQDYAGLNKLNDDFFVGLIRRLKIQYECGIRLVPMHTYWIGDDDRLMLNRICRKLSLPLVEVENRPLSLEDTMNVYANADICVGMRFHAILLQTILNGKNIVLDYTDPEKGKIINLLNQLNLKEKYKNRYVSLVDNPVLPSIQSSIEKIIISNDKIDNFKRIYVDSLKKVLL